MNSKMNTSGYDKRALSIDSPIYEYYAQKILDKTGIKNGICLDAGSGGGYLGLALSRITSLDFIFLDLSLEMLERAECNIKNAGIQKRARTLHADVHNIPLASESVDLIISRGSIPFWKEPVTALEEFYRILTPGGMVYVGTGRGTPDVKKQVEAKMEEMGEKSHNWEKEHHHMRGIRCDYDGIKSMINIANFRLDRGEDGSWIHIWK